MRRGGEKNFHVKISGCSRSRLRVALDKSSDKNAVRPFQSSTYIPGVK